jgi:hypothetical protein
VSALDRIAKLEALLARVKQRAEAPRIAAAPPPPIPLPVALPEPTIATVPPTSVARHAIELESRTRVVEMTMEIDEADLVPDSATQEAPVAETTEAPVVEIEVGEPSEPPPPSSKRPIPMEAIAEAQQHEPPPPPPPESGKLVAAPPAFDDDFTGVREASNLLPPLEPDAPAIEVQAVPPPKPAPVHEMEADLAPPAASTARRISDVAPAPPAALEPEITKAIIAPVASPVVMQGAVQTFKPATFGELLDATLGF